LVEVESKIRKIAVIVQKYGLVGGGERYVLELTERVAQNPHYEVHVLANEWLSASDRVIFHKIPILSFPRFLKPLSFAWFVKRKLAALNADIVHTHDRILEADVATLHGIPHRIWVKEVRKKSMSLFDRAAAWLETRLLTRSDCRKLLPVSGITKEKILLEFSVPPEKIEVIHPGVDLQKFSKDRRQCRKKIRKQFGVEESDLLILFVGMNFEIKGLDTLLSAIASAKAVSDSPKLKLLVVGKGNLKKYEGLSRELGLADDVIFAGVWEKNIEEIYLASDIFSMLSAFDTFGLAVLEAMASSLPVIISSHVGAKDLVEEGINGFIVEPEDADTVASKILFMENKDIRCKMGSQAYEVALRQGWDNIARQILYLYDQLLVNRESI
jgi:UDP-glucose:(heptosyl)LPS alpha-1,3-glucosyltransferase